MNTQNNIKEYEFKDEAIIIKNLIKSYHKHIVLNISDYKFYKGKVYLIVGANGSGKSTLIKSIIGIIKYSGSIKVRSKLIGYLPERFPEISLIKGIDFLNNLTLTHQKTSRGQIISQFQEYFDVPLNKNMSSLSKGNLQKVMIIQSMINKANLIILDEPMNGLDPNMQNRLIDMIKYMKNNERCIIITSHYPKYYKEVYDEVIYMEKGNIVNEVKASY